jgi:hypothetical protein
MKIRFPVPREGEEALRADEVAQVKSNFRGMTAEQVIAEIKRKAKLHALDFALTDAKGR